MKDKVIKNLLQQQTSDDLSVAGVTRDLLRILPQIDILHLFISTLLCS